MTIPLARDWLYTPERGFFRVRRHGQFYALYRPDEGDFPFLWILLSSARSSGLIVFPLARTLDKRYSVPP
jgi:hypothetical protein